MNEEELLILKRFMENIKEPDILRKIIVGLISNRESSKFILNCAEEWDKFFSIKN